MRAVLLFASLLFAGIPVQSLDVRAELRNDFFGFGAVDEWDDFETNATSVTVRQDQTSLGLDLGIFTSREHLLRIDGLTGSLARTWALRSGISLSPRLEITVLGIHNAIKTGCSRSAEATGIVWSTAVSPDGPIGPGHQASMTLNVHDNVDLTDLYLSAAAMLVNTNDAITALRSGALHELGVGQSWTVDLGSYDTGTEANSETAGTIPGPAGGGEGFNPTRDDVIDAVLGHPGAITSDDGLADSALHSIHRWNNPVARLRVRRTR